MSKKICAIYSQVRNHKTTRHHIKF